MARDITMIFSVLVSILSLIFGVYKNVEAGNAKAYALQQVYQIMGVVRQANIGAAAKDRIYSGVLDSLTTPPPVLNFSNSNADAPMAHDSCSEATKQLCLDVASRIAMMNTECAVRRPTVDTCTQTDELKQQIETLSCVTCFNK